MTVNIQKGMAPNNESYLAGRKRRRERSTEYPEEKRLKMDDGALTSCGIVLNYLMQHAYGKVFNEPIDPVKSGCPNYFEIIANPMDLGTVKRKLFLNLYEDVESFEGDVKLTFSNAMMYYKASSEVYQYAKELIAMFEFHLKPVIEKIMREQGNFRKFVDHNHRKVSMEKKMPPRNLPAQSGWKLRSEKPRTDALHISNSCSEVVLDNATASTSPLDVRHSLSKAMHMSKNRRGKIVHGEEKAKMKGQVRASDPGECSRAGFERRRKREKDRQAARVSLENMKRTSVLDDNINAFDDLNAFLKRPLLFRREFRNGNSFVSWVQSNNGNSVNPLKDLGLILKSDYAAGDDDNDMGEGDWEEGEIRF